MTVYGTSIYGKDPYGIEIIKGFIPNAISVVGVATQAGIALSWAYDKDPSTDSRVTGARIVRSTNHSPGSPFDGTLVTTDIVVSLFDTSAAIGTNYYAIYIMAGARTSNPGLITIERPVPISTAATSGKGGAPTPGFLRGGLIAAQQRVSSISTSQVLTASSTRNRSRFQNDSIKVPVGAPILSPEAGLIESLTKNQIVFRTTNGRKYRISNIAADTRLLGTIRRGERLGRSKGGFITIQIIQDNELLSFFDLQVV